MIASALAERVPQELICMIMQNASMDAGCNLRTEDTYLQRTGLRVQALEANENSAWIIIAFVALHTHKKYFACAVEYLITGLNPYKIGLSDAVQRKSCLLVLKQE